MNVSQYLHHLPTCNIMQDWSEAEMQTKQATCTCNKEAIEEVLVGLCNAAKKTAEEMQRVKNEMDEKTKQGILSTYDNMPTWPYYVIALEQEEHALSKLKSKLFQS